MATKNRRGSSSFGLSFLDVMFCGFGAVVLLVLLLSGKVINSRQQQVDELRPELVRQRSALRQATEEREQLAKMLETLETEVAALKQQTLSQAIAKEQLETAAISKAQEAEQQQAILSLQAELRELERQRRQQLSQQTAADEKARRVRTFEGEGNRQYLTGLKLGGKRVLLLVDASASMLDRKIVDIIRLKVRNEEIRKLAPKWQRAKQTMEWLVANLPPDTSISIHLFNQGVRRLGETQEQWVAVTDSKAINTVLRELQEVAPIGGTNLELAFKKARSLLPRPDNIILLTDGLPTTNRENPRAATITSKARAALFERAVNHLPEGVPVNTILFPMEGDPLAAVLFWQLAVESNGSFLTPTRDWP